MSWAGPFQYDIGKSRNAQQVPAEVVFDDQVPTLLCLSHLRWSFVYQRPQHLMSRFARDYNVLFHEEPIPTEDAEPWLEVRPEENGVQVLIPRLPAGCEGEDATRVQRQLLDGYLEKLGVSDLLLWYYTPMSLAFSDHLAPGLIVYDCMDELSAFRGAPPELVEREVELMCRANLVFTGGYSLYEAKRQQHDAVHPFPSGVDVAHFRPARGALPDPLDQAGIARQQCAGRGQGAAGTVAAHGHAAGVQLQAGTVQGQPLQGVPGVVDGGGEAVLRCQAIVQRHHGAA